VLFNFVVDVVGGGGGGGGCCNALFRILYVFIPLILIKVLSSRSGSYS